VRPSTACADKFASPDFLIARNVNPVFTWTAVLNTINKLGGETGLRLSMKYRFILLILLITFVTCTSFAQVKRHVKTQKVKDPVCGLMVDKDPELSVKYADVFYYFCSKADMEQFKKHPAKYARKQLSLNLHSRHGRAASR
jgi:YHS domain-containing protein